jgi:hypothetical protein
MLELVNKTHKVMRKTIFIAVLSVSVLVYMIFWLVRSGFTLNLKGSSMLDKQKWVLLIILACLVPLNGTASDPKVPDPTVRISYIANEGFLIETKQKKILIDALFGEEPMSFCDNPGEEALDDMIHDRGEFSQIDLVAVTHMHMDHFFTPLVSCHLLANPAARFISCQQTVELLKEEQDF